MGCSESFSFLDTFFNGEKCVNRRKIRVNMMSTIHFYPRIHRFSEKVKYYISKNNYFPKIDDLTKS